MLLVTFFFYSAIDLSFFFLFLFVADLSMSSNCSTVVSLIPSNC
jgi:hypothetical protein